MSISSYILISSTVFVVIALSGPSASRQATQAKSVTVPPAVAKLVTPILDALEESTKSSQPEREEEGSPLWKVGVLTGKLIRNKSAASDEALVVLLYYYTGEANGYDQMREITARGRRMLPYLYKYKTHLPRIPRRTYDEEILLKPDATREKFFQDAIDAIKRGKLSE